MSVGKRLMELYNVLKEKNIIKTKQEFCDIIGINYTAFNKYYKDEYIFKVTSDIIRHFSKNNLNLAWLLDGNGSMFLEKETSVTLEGDIYLQKQSKIAVQTYEDTQDYCFVDLIPQRISAGVGQSETQMDIAKQIPIDRDLIHPYKPNEISAVMVVGDSMINAGINHRDIVFYVREMIEGNGIYVIQVAGDFFVKRLEFDPFENTVTIISDNPNYQKKVISATSELLEIKGKVKFWFHKHPL